MHPQACGSDQIKFLPHKELKETFLHVSVNILLSQLSKMNSTQISPAILEYLLLPVKSSFGSSCICGLIIDASRPRLYPQDLARLNLCVFQDARCFIQDSNSIPTSPWHLQSPVLLCGNRLHGIWLMIMTIMLKRDQGRLVISEEL